MKPTVLVAARFLPRLLGRLGEHYILHGLERPEPEAVPSAAREARVLITVGGIRTDAALMDALPKLGLIVTHAGDTNATAVAEFAFGLVIATVRGILRGDRYARAGRWRGDIIERTASTPELAGQRLGIYGLGAIGTRIAARAAAFEMQIGYHNRRPRADLPYAYHPTLTGLAR